MENQENKKEGLSARDLEFKAFFDNLDVSKPSEEQKQQGKAFVSEKPLYAEMIMSSILMKAELTGDLHSFGKIAWMSMQFGITKEQMLKHMSDSFSGYWDGTEAQVKG